MPTAVCILCNATFLNVEDVDSDFKCSKCKKRKPGMSQTDYSMINVSLYLIPTHFSLIITLQNLPQCVACGLASNVIKNPLCNRCIEYYSAFYYSYTTMVAICPPDRFTHSAESAESTPNQLLAISGVYQLLQNPKALGELEEFSQTTNTNTFSEGGSMSREAMALLGTSAVFQGIASENRLGKPTVGTGGLNRFKGAAAPTVRSIRHDRSSKAQEIKNKMENGGISIHATLYAVELENNSKMTAVCSLVPFGNSYLPFLLT